MSSRIYHHFIVTRPLEWVAHVEINRPNKINAFFEEMWLELRIVFESLSVDPSIRAIVFFGAGDRAFTAGIDLQAAMAKDSKIARQVDDERDPARWGITSLRFITDFQACISSIEKCEKPVICVMHGHSYGLAIDMSTCADIRLCVSDAKFAVKEVDIGMAADIGTLTRLPRVVGSFSWVKNVCLTGRTFGAEEALRVGFVDSVFPSKRDALDEALKIATVIAQKSPVAINGIKEILNAGRDQKVVESLRYTAVWTAAAVQTKDIGISMGSLGKSGGSPRFEKL